MTYFWLFCLIACFLHKWIVSRRLRRLVENPCLGEVVSLGGWLQYPLE